MRHIIYGAGAIGGVVGAQLSLAGYDVVLIARPAHVEAIRKHGLRFVTPYGEKALSIPAVTRPDEITFAPGDVVFLCMKGQDTYDALAALKRSVSDVPVFCFQNGVRNEEIAGRYYRQVYGVMVHVGGVYLTPGEVQARRDPPGSLVLGCYPTGTDDLSQTVGDHLRAAGFRTLVTADIMPFKWGKLIGNLGNAIGAATNGHDPDGRIGAGVRGEAQALMRQAGIRWITWDAARQEHPELATPDRAALEGEVHGSTWQSLKRGEGSVEADFLNGEIVRLAQRLGATAPVNAALQRIVEAMAAGGDKPGKYTPAELSKLLGLVVGHTEGDVSC
jgi:2-dehydropantoate 2-reductase